MYVVEGLGQTPTIEEVRQRAEVAFAPPRAGGSVFGRALRRTGASLQAQAQAIVAGGGGATSTPAPPRSGTISVATYRNHLLLGVAAGFALGLATWGVATLVAR